MDLLTAAASAEFARPSASAASVETEAPPPIQAAEEPAPLVTDEPSQHEIAVEAYTRYLLRGAQDGHAVEDWLEAERAVRERRAG